jgi:N-methylhydantoinase B/oxoprolinase/acetone carboxylase alpha subunit
MTASTVRTKRSPRQASERIDPITFEVLRNHFLHICDRMAFNLKRSSFSPILADMTDFSNAIYDPNLNLLAQAANCPVHLAAMHFSAQAVAKKFGVGNLHDGDIVVLNDPYNGGTHIPDITFTKPVFFEKKLIGFAISRGHWMDLGGGAAGGQGFGTHVAAEGLRLPPLKIYNRGRPNSDVIDIMVNNTRTPHYVKGDLQAHVSALNVAEQELQFAAKRYGVQTLLAAMAELLAYTERVARKAIDEIPDGTYVGEDFADTDGISDRAVKVKATVIVKGSDITVDFTGSDPQCVGAINSPLANTSAAVFYALQFFMAPDAPANAGKFAPINIILPEDCWLNAKWPAPTIGCTTVTAAKTASAVWQALGKAIPERIMAAPYSDANWFVSACRDRNGRTDVFSDILSGGWGGTPFNDGMSVTFDPSGNCTQMTAEVAELFYPIKYTSMEMRPNSGGPGLHRGGLGFIFEVQYDHSGELSIETSCTRQGPPGANGGHRGELQRLWHVDSSRRARVIGGLDESGVWHNPMLAGHRFGPDEAFRMEVTGGGGWGNPYSRPTGSVLDDVIDEYITVEHAAECYGVVIDALTQTVNVQATKKLRSRGHTQSPEGAR